MQQLLFVTSGRGPAECCWAVARMTEQLVSDAHLAGIRAEVIESETGPEKGTLLSTLIHLEGDTVESFASNYRGTIRWIGHSPFRPAHKRKNWFISVQHVTMPPTMTIADSDIRIETMKGSGPGGQHVNTTESAVRATHIPTGLSAIARDERSQTLNRKKALLRLTILIGRRDQEIANNSLKKRWDIHNDLERGSAIRTYEGRAFNHKA